VTDLANAVSDMLQRSLYKKLSPENRPRRGPAELIKGTKVKEVAVRKQLYEAATRRDGGKRIRCIEPRADRWAGPRGAEGFRRRKTKRNSKRMAESPKRDSRLKARAIIRRKPSLSGFLRKTCADTKRMERRSLRSPIRGLYRTFRRDDNKPHRSAAALDR